MPGETINLGYTVVFLRVMWNIILNLCELRAFIYFTAGTNENAHYRLRIV